MLTLRQGPEVSTFIAEHFPFFDFGEYEVQGSSAVVRPVRGCRFLDSGATSEYLEHEESLLTWLSRLCRPSEEEILVYPQGGRWHTETSPETKDDRFHRAVRHWLSRYGLRRTFGGLVGGIDGHTLRNLAGCALRGYSQIIILDPVEKLLVIPCDHGDLHLFWSTDSPSESRIRRLSLGLELVTGCSR